MTYTTHGDRLPMQRQKHRALSLHCLCKGKSTGHCLCVFHSTKCLLLFGGAILNILCPRERRVFQSKLGVSSSNQCNLHHSPHTGRLEKKNKKRVQSFSDTVYTPSQQFLFPTTWRIHQLVSHKRQWPNLCIAVLTVHFKFKYKRAPTVCT